MKRTSSDGIDALENWTYEISQRPVRAHAVGMWWRWYDFDDVSSSNHVDDLSGSDPRYHCHHHRRRAHPPNCQCSCYYLNVRPRHWHDDWICLHNERSIASFFTRTNFELTLVVMSHGMPFLVLQFWETMLRVMLRRRRWRQEMRDEWILLL